MDRGRIIKDIINQGKGPEKIQRPSGIGHDLVDGTGGEFAQENIHDQKPQGVTDVKGYGVFPQVLQRQTQPVGWLTAKIGGQYAYNSNGQGFPQATDNKQNVGKVSNQGIEPGGKPQAQ